MPDLTKSEVKEKVPKKLGQAQKDAAVMLTLKSLEKADSRYVNKAMKIVDLAGAYRELGTMDRVIMNMGLMDLTAKGAPTQDPKTAYDAGRKYLWEYFNQELMRTRTDQGRLALEEKKYVASQRPLFRNVDLVGDLFGENYKGGKRNWTAEEAEVLFRIKYLVAQADAQVADAMGAQFTAQRKTIEDAKTRLGKVYDGFYKQFAGDEAKIWQATVKMANDPSTAQRFSWDWITVYDDNQARLGLPQDGEERFRTIITTVPKTGKELTAGLPFAPLLRLLYGAASGTTGLVTGKNLGEWLPGKPMLTPPVSGVGPGGAGSAEQTQQGIDWAKSKLQLR